MTETVVIGNLSFVIQDQGTPEDRAAVKRSLETYAKMAKVQKDMTGQPPFWSPGIECGFCS